jgi:hypothetical protein
MLGVLGLCVGDDNEARVALQRGIDMCRGRLGRTPGLYEEHYTLALALAAAGRDDEAHTCLQEAMSLCCLRGVLSQAQQDLQCFWPCFDSLLAHYYGAIEEGLSNEDAAKQARQGITRTTPETFECIATVVSLNHAVLTKAQELGFTEKSNNFYIPLN